MRVLLITFPSNSNSMGGENLIVDDLKTCFESLGHNVLVRDRNNIITDENVDFVLSLNVPIEIYDKKNAIWATWVFNENLGVDADSICKFDFDIYFTNSEKLKNDILSNGCDSFYLNFFPSPKFEYDLIDSYFNNDVMYLGNYNPEYKTREKINQYLIPCMNYDFVIYGNEKWKIKKQIELSKQDLFNSKYLTQIFEPYYKGFLPENKLIKIQSLSKIQINFNAPIQHSLGMINNRMFDLLNAGCFIITDKQDEQENLFKDCIDYSLGDIDLGEKISFYLKHENLIEEKKIKSLDFINDYKKENSVFNFCQKIIDIVESKKNKNSQIRNSKKMHWVVFNMFPNMLSSCLKSILNNDISKNITIISEKKNRIKTNTDLQTCELSTDNLILIDSFSELKNLNLKTEDFIIPCFSNQIFPKNFGKDILIKIKNTSKNNLFFMNKDINDFNKKIYGLNNNLELNDNTDLSDQFPIGFFVSKKWNNCFLIKKEDGLFLEDIHSNFFFETENEREYFKKIIGISNQTEKRIDKKNDAINVIPEKKTKSKMRFSFLTEKYEENNRINIYEEHEVVVINNDLENKIRELRSHYSIIGEIHDLDIEKIKNIILTRSNNNIFVVGDIFFIKTSYLYEIKPFSNIQDLKKYLLDDSIKKCRISEKTYDIKNEITKSAIIKSSKGLKVAVMSMCGVFSYEDKYGIGGEHQVVHWLKNEFDNREDVYLCHIFDTFNYDMLNPDDYDIIFSNSCWRSVEKKRKRKDNLTIFWHFNTDSNNATFETVELLNYDMIWTNSLTGYEYFKNKGLNCKFKQLNASSQYHKKYEYESRLYRHDVAYIGGYQLHYKGKEMIESFIKVLCNKEFDFAIYGNRLWKSSVQKEALKNDRFFLPEYYDDTYDKYYHGILPMQDFNILCKNTKILINMTAADQVAVQMSNDRPIWQLACGGFVITDDFLAARQFYKQENSKDCPVVFSLGKDDLVEKVRYYLQNEKERKKISEKGPDFVINNKLYSKDTIDLIMQEYYSRNK